MAARRPLGRGSAWALLAVALLAATSAAVTVGRELTREWRQHQRAYAAVTGRAAPGIVEVAPTGEPERCQTCHLNLGHATPERGQHPLRGHPPILTQHPPARDGCVACHGGAGRALDRRAAHPGSGPHELRRGGFLAAGCPRCHTLGSVAGDQTVRDGLELFVDLGCIACHRAGNLDVVAEFGPDLSRVGLRGSAYLRRATREPTRLFPGTKMPDFAGALKDRRDEDALVTFLLSLRGEPRRPGPADSRAALPCVTCHRAPKPQGPKHRCVFIREHREELTCARCHGAEVPPGPRECRYIAPRRFVCGACHGGPRGR